MLTKVHWSVDMPLTRKLTDLFVEGENVTIEDGKGEAVELYVRKITPLDAEEAYRAANAARSQAMALRTNPDDPIFQILMRRCEEATKEEMLEQLVEVEVAKRQPVLEAELEAEDKWSKDDYLQGLHDAWESGLKKQHFTEPTEETERVLNEMTAFKDELEKRLERERTAVEKDLGSKTHDQIKDEFFDAQIDRQAEIAWLTEYRRQELYHAVRDAADHDVKAFESAREVDASSTELIKRLREVYNNLTVDALEGKD